ncbi:hypothetical protein H2200_005694 [Cladophialophora chaetospira]|uniref:Histone deacetylase complex subunit SAP30 Sin3 binding domain-containing protein n=1 Tax=Cladophialophora chaetospira TaxID=386627 RepID=A0AA38X9I9_9EURO|nr:hypothetical protein H2200_005694 [Cladophialophora chaetospira]
MPPPRARNVDDSRSETSSTVTNQREKLALGPTSGSGVSKGKRSALGHHGTNGGAKVAVNGSAPALVLPAAATAAEAEKDPSLPRVCFNAQDYDDVRLMLATLSQTEWNTMPVPVLRTYRMAHRLPISTAFDLPHTEITYKSSEIAKRAPSAVYYRRKLHEQHLQRRRARQAQQANGTSKSSGGPKSKEKGKAKDVLTTEKSSNTSLSIAQSIEPPDHHQPPSEQDQSSTLSTSASTYLGPRLPASNLASAVRKHFNAQQLVGGEADTIARFIYVVQQNGSTRQVRTEGSEGDGTGYWMGSNGREQRKVDGPGGEVGFRLRFKP